MRSAQQPSSPTEPNFSRRSPITSLTLRAHFRGNLEGWRAAKNAARVLKVGEIYAMLSHHYRPSPPPLQEIPQAERSDGKVAADKGTSPGRAAFILILLLILTQF